MKIAAINVIGMGTYSSNSALVVTIETEPDSPSSAPSLNSFSEDDAELELADSRRLLSSTSPILYYELLWDQGSNGVTWTSYTVTNNNIVTVTGLSSGLSYKFKYRLQNIHGWGDYSPVLTVTASDIPQQVNAVVTTNEDADVKIYWDIPFSGGLNIPILSYDILIQKSDGSFINYLPACDGSSVSVITDHYCIIPMTMVTQTHLGLTQG